MQGTPHPPSSGLSVAHLDWGKGIVVIAKSGTGKTLSYLLPGFIKVARAAGNGGNTRGPRMLVMVATRELWQQIRSESERFGRPANIATAVSLVRSPLKLWSSWI